MKTKLKKFRIFTMTKFGAGFFEIKAIDFKDCIKRIGHKKASKAMSITDLETDEEITINELLGVEL